MRWIGMLVLAVGFALLGASCFDYVDDCTLSLTCPPGTGTDSGMPTACDPTKASGPVADSCGVFVSPAGDDGNAGYAGEAAQDARRGRNEGGRGLRVRRGDAVHRGGGGPGRA